VSVSQPPPRISLARAWLLRGQIERARLTYEAFLAEDPSCLDGWLQLGELEVHANRLAVALAHYQRAAALAPHTPGLGSRLRHLEELQQLATGAAPPTRQNAEGLLLEDQPGGRLDLRDQLRFGCHRSGWGAGLDALRPLHHRGGVRFDGFLERNFAWRHGHAGSRPTAELLRLKRDGLFDQEATSEELGLTPYREPWVGVMHNPPRMPAWFHPADAPQTILAKRIWRESLPFCRGLFTLSQTHAAWLRQHTLVPVSALIHPTAMPEIVFDFNAFLANRHRRIVQVGWWLRRLNAIRELPLAADNPLGYSKLRLVPAFFEGADGYLRELMERELRETGGSIDPSFEANTEELAHLADAAYDQLLAENIVFVQLYDASANNTVVECLARGTPLLINPLPAVIEYLGADYPLYYDDLETAVRLALDTGRIRAAQEHMLANPVRKQLDPARFRERLEASEIFQSLPPCGV